MENRPWWKVFKRFLGIAVLSFVLYALVDLLYLSFLPLRLGKELATQLVERTWEPYIDIRQDVDYWRKILVDQPPLTRTVTISATATELTLDLDLSVEKTHDLVSEAAEGRLDDAILPFAQAAFGEIYVAGKELSEEAYSDPIWTLDPESEVVHIYVQASKEVDQYTSVRVDRAVAPTVMPEHDVLVAEFDGLRLSYLYPIPDKVTRSSTYLTRTAPEAIGYLNYSFEPLKESGVGGSYVSRSVREQRQRFLQRLGNVIDLPFISRMLYSVLRMLPLLIFLLLVARSKVGKSPFAISLAEMVASLLLFHFTLYFLSAGGQLLSDSPLVDRLSELVTKAIEPYFQPNVRPLFGLGPYRVSVAILGVLLPSLLWQRSSSLAQRTKRRGVRFICALVVILLIAGLVIPVVYVLLSQWPVVRGRAEDIGVSVTLGTELLRYWKWLLVEKDVLVVPLWSVALFASSLIALLIWWVLTHLYRRVALSNPPPGLALSATFVIVLMAAVNGYARGVPYSWETWEPWFFLVLSTTFGFVLLLSLVNVVRTQLQRAVPGLALPLWTRRLLVLLVVSLAIPMAKVVDSGWSLATYSTIMALAYRLVEWLIPIWMVGVFYLLYQEGRTGPKVRAFPRIIGILGISSLLFGVTARWLYIPITFLIGWLTLEWWLVRPSDYWETLKSFFKEVVQERVKLLDHILDLRVAEKAYRELRKKLGEECAAGDLSFEDYDNQLELRRDQLNKLRDRATIKGRPAKELALAFGPYPSAWQNGVHGAKFALLFGLPWIALYLKDFLSGPMPQQSYPLWGFGADLLIVVLRWMTYGFFFGYFYPYLRGKAGLQKGLFLFLVSVLPALPLMAIFNTTATQWQASLFWTLQVFIHSMLLGLVAFDYVILRQGRYEWQMLFEVHGLPSLGVSVSSILVAIGAAVTTLMTTQVTNLVALALKFIIPEVPSELPTP